MSTVPRSDDEPERPHEWLPEDDLFADLPAFDVIDGELMPRGPRRDR
ncbi:hypothetical protein [Microbacterium oleivorans]|uniref:Uncharacterized protein n=1 Tax=Microbacterium oleivorans TaxID=273677 RepID=A0A7D5IT57_9MICO|nr:hypothetical protein [Microbacterium oleivorans]QLD12117.1 hypothetical protein HW566_10280 [Microbacterium oleivorans]